MIQTIIHLFQLYLLYPEFLKRLYEGLNGGRGVHMSVVGYNFRPLSVASNSQLIIKNECE